VKSDYLTLPHVKGKPFILAIADFHEESSMTWSSSALTTYLYGRRFTWRLDKRATAHPEHPGEGTSLG